MTTPRKPTSGRAQKTTDLDSYHKQSKASNVGNHMRTFARTKTSGLITAWNDPHFMTIKGQHFKFIADATGAVDSSTVGDPGGLVLLDVLWETHFENANLKDLVANDEASWKLYFLVMLQICIDFQIQYNYRCHLPAYTEADAVPGTETALTFLEQSSYDIFIASMAEFPVPKGVYELVDIFASWIVRITPEYERFTLRIPPAYYVPFYCVYDLLDFQAMRQLLRVNLGGFVTHAKKYGLGTTSWRDPKPPVIKDLHDVDVIAYFNHSPFKYIDKNVATLIVAENGGFTGTDKTDDYALTQYGFKDNPNESKMHVLAPWFGVYDATNNPYGGFIHQGAPNAAEYYVNLSFVAQHGIDVAIANLGDAIITDTMLLLHKAASDNVAATFTLEFNGTDFTATRGLDDCWPLGYYNDLFYGAGRGYDETTNDLINFLGRILR